MWLSAASRRIGSVWVDLTIDTSSEEDDSDDNDDDNQQQHQTSVALRLGGTQAACAIEISSDSESESEHARQELVKRPCLGISTTQMPSPPQSAISPKPERTTTPSSAKRALPTHQQQQHATLLCTDISVRSTAVTVYPNNSTTTTASASVHTKHRVLAKRAEGYASRTAATTTEQPPMSVCELCGVKGDLPPEANWDDNQDESAMLFPWISTCCSKPELYCLCEDGLAAGKVHYLCASMAGGNQLTAASKDVTRAAYRKLASVIKIAQRNGYKCSRESCSGKNNAYVTCCNVTKCRSIWHWPCLCVDALEGRAQKHPTVRCGKCLKQQSKTRSALDIARALKAESIRALRNGKTGIPPLKCQGTPLVAASKLHQQLGQAIKEDCYEQAKSVCDSQLTSSHAEGERHQGSKRCGFVDSANALTSAQVTASCVPSSLHAGLVLSEDLSNGQERVPIRCINFVDNEPMPPFLYIKERRYHPSSGVTTENLKPATGCTCCQRQCGSYLQHTCSHYKHHIVNGADERDSMYIMESLLEKRHKSAAVELEPLPMAGRLAYNRAKRVQVPPGQDLIAECNDNCACNSSCPNRVVQLGIQLQLEVFKTPDCGWGLRTTQDIERGTFVVEYVGEVISHDEAVKRGEQYEREGVLMLFDIDGSQEKSEGGGGSNAAQECKYVVDPTHCGNMARFINHSCDANLSVYNVLVETADMDLHRIGFFAKRDIRAGTELTYDYCWYKPGESDVGDASQESEARPAQAGMVHIRHQCSLSSRTVSKCTACTGT
eukprot:jgi/Chlat1/8416/Chrsp80S07915